MKRNYFTPCRPRYTVGPQPFVDGPPSVAQGGTGIVLPGCPACRKRINTMAQFLDHLADDVLPGLLDKLSNRRSG